MIWYQNPKFSCLRRKTVTIPYSVVLAYMTSYMPDHFAKFSKFSKTSYMLGHKEFQTKTLENTEIFRLRRPETRFRYVHCFFIIFKYC